MKRKYQLKDIGEFGFIEQISKLFKLDSRVIKGIGDDTAVLKYSADKYLLFTADMIIEDVHFRSSLNPEHVGHKALACNISDIAAMGGVPTHAVISVGWPVNLGIDFVKGIYRGINKLAKKFKINIVGGDTNKAQKIIINIALLGEVEKNNLTLRSTAKNGDWIFVSGLLGGSQSGRHATFMPRLKEARYLVKNYRINSMIDISDGIIADLNHILETSKAGALIYEELIPRRKNVAMNEALYTGEDFELLFTLPEKEAQRLIYGLARIKNPNSFTCIGRITNKKSQIGFVSKKGSIKFLKPQGYRHF